MTKKNFYVYLLADGDYGIVETWDECKKAVHRKSAEYKGFSTKEAARAWLDKKIGHIDVETETEDIDLGYNF